MTTPEEPTDPVGEDPVPGPPDGQTAPEADPPPQKTSGGVSHWLFPMLGVLCILGAIGWTIAGWFGPAPIMPDNMDALDPKVRELIEEGVGHVSRNRSDLTARMKLGMVYQANGLYTPAIETYEQVLEKNPDFARGHFHLATSLERAGDLDAAILAMKQAETLMPNRAETQARLGGWLLDNGDLDGARHHIDRALELQSDFGPALYWKVRLLNKEQKGSEARALIEQHQLLDGPFGPYGHRLLADAHRADGDLDAAAVAMDKAGDRRPRFGDPWLADLAQLRTGLAHMRGVASRMVQGRQFLQARQLLEEILESDPDDVRSRTMLALCLIETSQNDQAVEQLERVLELEPENYQAHLNLARAQIRRQPRPTALQLQSAFDHLQQCIDLQPDNAAAYQVKGSLLTRLSRFDEAIDTLKLAFERDARNILPLMQAGSMELQMNRPADARESFERAHRVDERAWAPLLGLANAWIAMGEFDEAEDALQRAGALPDTPTNQIQATRARLEQRRAGGDDDITMPVIDPED